MSLKATKKTFKELVFEVVAKIKPGSVLTYKQVAEKTGHPKAYRAVGTVLKSNYDPTIPCHRVVRSDGTTGQYNRGADTKVERLREEGALKHPLHGQIFGLYKPKGPSSNQLLTNLKRIVKVKRVGHAGTLDPLASGVLVVGVGREATKLLWHKDHDEKVYEAGLELGADTATHDSEGERFPREVRKPPTLAEVKNALARFEGHLLQTPPQYSALKVAGKPAYERVRKGETLELKARPAHIKKIEVLHYAWPHLEVRVTTGPGVYIRSLARDIGNELGTGAYLTSLVRTRVGKFILEECLRIENLT